MTQRGWRDIVRASKVPDTVKEQVFELAKRFVRVSPLKASPAHGGVKKPHRCAGWRAQRDVA